jgi:nucleotide-binding universal stress UspA family protein
MPGLTRSGKKDRRRDERSSLRASRRFARELEEDMGTEKGETLRLKKIADQHLHGVEHEFVVRIGRPAAEVFDAVRDSGADLIVLPTHGRERPKRLVLGSVAEHIIRESNIAGYVAQPARCSASLRSMKSTKKPKPRARHCAEQGFDRL